MQFAMTFFTSFQLSAIVYVTIESGSTTTGYQRWYYSSSATSHLNPASLFKSQPAVIKTLLKCIKRAIYYLERKIINNNNS